MNIILFGPPGVGKSTLIGNLKASGKRAIDLEDLYPSRVRFQVPSWVDDTVIGAADLDPKRNYPNALKVLLWLPQKTYEQRRAKRDSVTPGKSNQAPHQMADWLSVPYDAYLRMDFPEKKVLQYYDAALQAGKSGVPSKKEVQDG